MKVYCENEKSCMVVTLDGDLTVPECESLKELILDRIESGARQLLIDFGSVNYIDSSGIGVLLVLLKAARKSGGDIRLSGTKPNIRDVFRQVGLHRIFRRFENRETGIESFTPS
jgi:anti-anti-sigma factor